MAWLRRAVRVKGDSGPTVMVNLDGDYRWLTLARVKGSTLKQASAPPIASGKFPGVKVGGDYGSVKWASATSEQIAAALDVARHMVRELSSASE